MAEIPPRESQGLFWKDSDEQAQRNKALEDFRKGEEAALERERIKRGEPPREFRRLSDLSHAARADSSSCR